MNLPEAELWELLYCKLSPTPFSGSIISGVLGGLKPVTSGLNNQTTLLTYAMVEIIMKGM